MIEALNMQLEIIRTVSKNSVSEVSVCRDILQPGQTFYTMITIYSIPIAKRMIERISAQGVFGNNKDYLGGFSGKDTYGLVFKYHNENLLKGREKIYFSTFQKQKEGAISFLKAAAELSMDDDLGILLMNDLCINITSAGSVYFNYYLDFSIWRPKVSKSDYMVAIGRKVFEILSFEYEEKYGVVEEYPHELKLFYRKYNKKGFPSFSSMISFIKELPDIVKPPRRGFGKILNLLDRLWVFIKNNGGRFVLGIVVIFTVFYLIFQISARVGANQNTEKNTRFVGMEYIGDVYLGEEII